MPNQIRYQFKAARDDSFMSANSIQGPQAQGEWVCDSGVNSFEAAGKQNTTRLLPELVNT